MDASWKDIENIAKLIKQGKSCICETDTVMGIISLKEEDIYKYKARFEQESFCFYFKYKTNPQSSKEILYNT